MVYFINGGTEASQITTSTNNTYTFPYNEYTGRYGRFDMTTNLTSVPWSSKVIVGTHVDINYGSAPPTIVCDLWSQVTITGDSSLPVLSLQYTLTISDEGDLINGKRYWNKTERIKGGGDRILQIQWNGNQWIFTVDEGGSTVTAAQGGTLLYPYDCQTGGDDMVMNPTGEYLPQYTEWSTESGGTNLNLTTLSFKINLGGGIQQKLTAISDGTTSNPPNGVPIYTVNDGTSDYVVQWNGANWEITKSTGGSNPVVITTNTDVTYEWDELPDNEVVWTMTSGENVITTGNIT